MHYFHVADNNTLRWFFAPDRVCWIANRGTHLLDGHRLGEIAWLVDIAAAAHRDVVRQ